MIELFAADTPNGKKISIMLEEIKLPYKVTKVNLSEGEQFKEDFIKISPFSKIPVIKDSDNGKSVFGSGAILIYLAEKTQKFYHSKNKINIDEWLMAQMGLVGPQIGAYHHFYHFNKGKSKYSEERYFKITKDLYQRLNDRLSVSKYLAGEEYTIADIATWPWIARFEIHKVKLEKYPNVFRWYKLIAKRPAVIKGYNVIGEHIKIPMP